MLNQPLAKLMHRPPVPPVGDFSVAPGLLRRSDTDAERDTQETQNFFKDYIV